ncbi:MAG: acyltransferase [Bacteroidetes bacterium]|nr:acyltransferase [Bacteroidota bacterium]
MRGIAALLTVLYHADLIFGHGGNLLLPFKFSLLFTKLYLMVDFFFILSGFILCHVYAQWFSIVVSWPAFKKFTLARLGRVYPLHVATLWYLILVRVIFLCFGGVDTEPFSGESFTWVSIPTNLLLIQSMNVHGWFSWNNAAWSISTEWWMYMLFPLLVGPFLRFKRWFRVLVGLLCVGGYLFIMFFLRSRVTVPSSLSFLGTNVVPDINVAYQYGFVRCFCGFVLGMVVWRAYTEGFARKFFANGVTLLAWVVGIVICLHFAVYDVLTVCFFPAVILSAAYGSKTIDRVFSGRAVQRLGDLSFSIYLVHQPILYTWMMAQALFHLSVPVPGFWVGWLIGAVFVALTIWVASGTYKYIEVPARKWLNGLYTC